jgi:proteasome lid subunit RPN8/RPN11
MFAALAIAAALAAPVEGEMLDHPDVRSCAERVLKAGGYGHLPLEAAAFVVRDGNTYACEMWPRAVTYHSASWSRRVPSNVVAIIHSHPADLPEPSVGDADLARRLGIPVVVVTPRTIIAAGINFVRKLTY